jgi:hypothetical protein
MDLVFYQIALRRTAQISKEKQSIITLKDMKFSQYRKLQVSSSAVAKTIKRYDDTASEDRHMKGRTSYLCCSSLVTSLRNCSPNKCFRV